jgi:RimJ/RimL family protein N-acetyltransferase
MKTIHGIKTNLIEISESDAADIVKLRNDPVNNKYLYQKEITVEEQIQWTIANKNRTDGKNFKVTNTNNEFKGTISIYNIVDRRGEWGRYIVTNPVNAIEAVYLLLKFCFEELDLLAVYGQANSENKAGMNQHSKLGFREIGVKDVIVGSSGDKVVKAIVHEITAEQYKEFNYDKIIKLINFF